MNVPAFLKEYYRQPEDDPDDDFYFDDPRGDPDFEEVSDTLVGTNKYSNINERIWRHVPTGRFIRTYTHSLPYGIEDDYGMEDEDDDIDEVFPTAVVVIRYLTEK